MLGGHFPLCGSVCVYCQGYKLTMISPIGEGRVVVAPLRAVVVSL